MPDRNHRQPDPDASNQRGVRLQRVMADAGVASRRDCEEMIQKGLVEVNGEIADHLPVFVDPAKDRITVEGKLLKIAKPAQDGSKGLGGRVYVMLHKPDRVLCTTSDELGAEGGGDGGAGRTTVIDLVNHSSGARLYPAGRLDYHTTGLVLMTNDGALADRLTHARYGITRTYRVTLKGRVSQELLSDLRRRLGVQPSRGGAAREDGGDSVRLVRQPGEVLSHVHRPDATGPMISPNSVIEITLREGKSKQLRPIIEQMGALVRKLTRTAIGPLRLRGVAVGEWRDLSQVEGDDLMVATGLAAPGKKLSSARRPARAEGGRNDKRGGKPAQTPGGRGGPGGRSRSRDRDQGSDRNRDRGRGGGTGGRRA